MMFSLGQRVQYSPEGIAHLRPAKPQRRATVVGHSWQKPECVLVVFDGTKTPQRYHASFLKPTASDMPVDAPSSNGKTADFGPAYGGSTPSGATAKYPESVPGVITFACSHLVNVGYGPARVSQERCRDCLDADDELGVGARESQPVFFGRARAR